MLYGHPNFPCLICLCRSNFHSYKMMSYSYKRMSDAYQEFLPIRPSEFLQISIFRTCFGFLHTKQFSETSLFFCKNSEYCKYIFACVSTITFPNNLDFCKYVLMQVYVHQSNFANSQNLTNIPRLPEMCVFTYRILQLIVLKICPPPFFFCCKTRIFTNMS